ncbi:MAG: winged helix-turn-helix domain-containing protein [Actinomycetes bacterium]
MVPTARTRKQAVSRALRALERQHHSRYVELYQEEFQQAWSQPHSRRAGRPAGTSDRLTITPGAASTWRRNGAGRRRPRQQGEGARQRAADLFAQGVRPFSVAGQLGVARQSAVRWTSARAAVVIQRITGVQLGRKAVHRLLRKRLGWRSNQQHPRPPS